MQAAARTCTSESNHTNPRPSAKRPEWQHSAAAADGSAMTSQIAAFKAVLTMVLGPPVLEMALGESSLSAFATSRLPVK